MYGIPFSLTEFGEILKSQTQTLRPLYKSLTSGIQLCNWKKWSHSLMCLHQFPCSWTGLVMHYSNYFGAHPSPQIEGDELLQALHILGAQ